LGWGHGGGGGAGRPARSQRQLVTRTIAETRQYLDDAEELLRTENTAVDFFNAGIERDPNQLGRTVLWAGASALYGVREHPRRTSARSSSPPGFEPRRCQAGADLNREPGRGPRHARRGALSLGKPRVAGQL
jgi:hypothetical protein